MEIKITEANGWSKLISVNKAITQIGSAPNIDVRLPSTSVAPHHLQIFSNPDLPTGCRVVNMATQLEVKNQENHQPLAPYSAYDLSNGDEIQLGEYLLSFSLPNTTTTLRTAVNIEASLTFMDTTLHPELGLEGLLIIKNKGGKDACQFQVVLSGLPEDCFHIDPIPLLYPGAQEEVRVQLLHKVLYPQAGPLEILLTINALNAYPGETVVIRQGIYVAPIFRQSLRIMDDLSSTSAPEPISELVSLVEAPSIVEDVQPELSVEQGKVESVLTQDEPLSRIEVDEEPPKGLPEQGNGKVKKKKRAKSQPASTGQADSTPVVLNQNPMVPLAPVPDNEGIISEPTLLDVQVPIIESKLPQIEGNNEDKNSEQAAPHPEIWADEAHPEVAKTPISQDLNLSKVKVVRTQTDKYWGE